MEADFLTACLAHPETLSEETLDTLSELKKRFPWSTPVRMLYLRNLLNLGLLDTNELAQAALHLPKQEILYTMQREKALPPAPPQKDTEEKEAASPRTDSFALIEQFLNDKEKDLPRGLDSLYNISTSKDYLAWLKVETEEDEDLMPEEEADEQASPLQYQSLIDDFLDKEPSPTLLRSETGNEEHPPTPITGFNSNEVSTPDTDSEVFATISMARIYIRQARYEQALQIIKNLHLKNQKKSTYFADQIRYLEKLITNTKK